MTADGEVNYLPVPVVPQKPPGRYARFALVTVVCGGAALLLAWVYVGSWLIHRPIMKDVRPALYIAYLVAASVTLASAAISAVQFILYYNNRTPGKTPVLRGVAITCAGVGLALASYVILVAMNFWLHGGRIVIMHR
jgi:hypothetical protein